MKLRIRGNSLRLRLVKAEVAEFADKGVLEDAVAFPVGPSLRYRLEVADTPQLTAQFDGHAVRVLVPRAQASAWTQSETISLVGEQAVEAGALKILIEKDFACRNPSSVWQEDQSDSYPNPHPSCG